MAKRKVSVRKAGYDWKKTAWKTGRSAVIVLVAGLLATFGQDPKWLAFAPAAEAFLNWLKHRKK